MVGANIAHYWLLCQYCEGSVTLSMHSFLHIWISVSMDVLLLYFLGITESDV